MFQRQTYSIQKQSMGIFVKCSISKEQSPSYIILYTLNMGFPVGASGGSQSVMSDSL